MNKSTHKSRARTSAETTGGALLGGMVDQVLDRDFDAREFVGDIRKAFPKITKFARENWRQIAIVSGAVAILAVGVYTYFNHDRISEAESESEPETDETRH